MNTFVIRQVLITLNGFVKHAISILVKNKIPSCAVVNGMVFPQKTAFFDLNELECRLLAPRIAFQKLMQAPRGRQLKIHGNIVNVPTDVTVHSVSTVYAATVTK